MPAYLQHFRHARRRAGVRWRLRMATAGLTLVLAGAGSAMALPSAQALPTTAQPTSVAASPVRWTYVTDAVARGRLEAAVASGRELLDRLVMEPGQADRLALHRALTSSELLIITSQSQGASTAQLDQSRRTLAAAIDRANLAQEAAVDAALTEALSAAQTQLAAWEPIVTDPSRLERLRSAVTAAEGLPATATQQARINATSELVTRTAEIPTISTETGPTTIDGIVVANKSLSLPADYAPGLLPEVSDAFSAMQAAAAADGISLWIDSGFRSYLDQQITYDGYANRVGTELADNFSSRPGHSEHQTGLSIDVNNAHPDFAGTSEALWLAEHAAEFGFVVRYPDGKSEVTGYTYEPWHLRYLGVDLAQRLTADGLTLEEYLGITSSY